MEFTQLDVNQAAQHRLLVVDDGPSTSYLSTLLSHSGYVAEFTRSSIDALEKIRSEPIDLVVVDLGLSLDDPDPAGLRMLRQLREEFSPLELPVIAVTTTAQSQRIVTCLRSGANDCVTRPFSIKTTLARIETQLTMKQRVEARSGEFRRLSGSLRAIIPVQRRYCLGCITAQTDPDGDTCHHCGAAAPPEGWRQTRDSPWPYLGRVLGGRYRMERLIDTGATGQVYHATDLDLGRDFAVKVIDLANITAFEEREGLRRRLLMEIEALVNLKTPHSVRIYQVIWVENDVWALIMDFCRGDSLEALIDARGPLEPDLALAVTRQVASALHETHSLGILHRDIKPANIMLEQMSTGEFFVRVLDFGLAQALDRPAGPKVRVCGTPEYLAPELLLTTGKADARSDIYALGVTLYQMLTGVTPFAHDDISELITLHLRAPIPPLPEELQGSLLEDLITQMMAKDPDARFSDARELWEELAALTAHVH